MDNNLDQIPGAGWVLDDQGRPVLDLGGEVLHGNTLLSGLLHNYNLPIAQDVSNTSPEQGPQLSDVPALARENLIRGGQYIKDHPGEILAGLASPELGVPWSIAAGLGGYLFDSMHPFSKQAPDYKTKSAKEYIANALLSGALNAVPASKGSDELTDAGLRSAMTDASNFASREVVPEASESMKTGFVGPSTRAEASFEPWPGTPLQAPNLNIGPKPRTIPAEDVGGVPTYQVLNYDAIPGSKDIEKKLIDEGKPRFVPSSTTKNPFFDDLLVGNNAYTTDMRTPEGQLYAERMSGVDPSVQRELYAGWSPKTFNPDQASYTMAYKGNPNEDEMLHGAEELDFHQDPASGLWYKPKWLSNRTIGAESYSHPILETPQYGDAIKAAIQSGKITKDNLPKMFSSVKALEDWADTYQQHRSSDIQTVYNNILAGDPRLQGQYATYVPFIKNPRIIDKRGEGWHKALPGEPEYVPNMPFEQGGHEYQNLQIANARKQGKDAVIYKNQVDPGNLSDQVWQFADPEKYAAGLIPQNVHVVFNPRSLSYPESYMWRNSMRPLAAAPIAAGLGSYLLKQKEKKDEQ